MQFSRNFFEKITFFDNFLIKSRNLFQSIFLTAEMFRKPISESWKGKPLIKWQIYLQLISISPKLRTIAATLKKRWCRGGSPRSHGPRKATNKFYKIFPQIIIFPKGFLHNPHKKFHLCSKIVLAFNKI
jgi:hypothetical protein